MKTIFADSYFFLAFGNSSDAGHRKAIEYAARYRGQIITTDWILTEVGDGFAAPSMRLRFLELFKLIEMDPKWEIIEATRQLHLRGVKLYAERPDKAWSLTDCISFVVMEELALVEALTGDRHFEQAGFIALLK